MPLTATLSREHGGGDSRWGLQERHVVRDPRAERGIWHFVYMRTNVPGLFLLSVGSQGLLRRAVNNPRVGWLREKGRDLHLEFPINDDDG